jgi:hypothetical protein
MEEPFSGLRVSYLGFSQVRSLITWAKRNKGLAKPAHKGYEGGVVMIT